MSRIFSRFLGVTPSDLASLLQSLAKTCEASPKDGP
jgi:hypothetical protein